MSWWDSGPDVLGDVPADQLKSAWRRILSEREESGAGNPALDEALRAYAHALLEAGLNPPLQQLVLKREGQSDRVFSGNEDAPKDLVDAFAEALPAIVQAYQRTLQRAPTPVEAAKTFEFIVSAHPETYLSEPVDKAFWQDARLRALPATGGASVKESS